MNKPEFQKIYEDEKRRDYITAAFMDFSNYWKSKYSIFS